MRQEGSQSNASNPSGPNGQNASGMIGGDATPLSVQSMDDIHHHLHSQNSQTLSFSDMY